MDNRTQAVSSSMTNELIAYLQTIPSSLKQKNYNPLSQHIAGLGEVIKKGGQVKKNEDGSFTVEVSKKNNSLLSMGLKDITEIKQYDIEIVNNKVVIENRENEISENDCFVSNVMKDTISTYEIIENGNCVVEDNISNKVNSFAKSKNVLRQSFVRELDVKYKKTYDSNWNRIMEIISYGNQFEYTEIFKNDQFIVFAHKPTINMPISREILYKAVISKLTGENYVVKIDKDKTHEDITLCRIDLKNSSYDEFDFNTNGKKLSRVDFSNMLSSDSPNYMDPSIFINQIQKS